MNINPERNTMTKIRGTVQVRLPSGALTQPSPCRVDSAMSLRIERDGDSHVCQPLHPERFHAS